RPAPRRAPRARPNARGPTAPSPLLLGWDVDGLELLERGPEPRRLGAQVGQRGPRPRRLLLRLQVPCEQRARRAHSVRHHVLGIRPEELVVTRQRPPVVAGDELVVAARDQLTRAAGHERERQDEEDPSHDSPRPPHRHCSAPRRGRTTVKRLPLPSCDSTETRPPCAWTIARTMASP